MTAASRRVLVCGGRDYANLEYMRIILGHAHKSAPFTLLIHGGAAGADALAGRWAKENGVPVQVFEADWVRDGAAAGPLRNLRMLAEGKPDLVVAFPGGKGTAHMRKIATAHGVRVVRVPSMGEIDTRGEPETEFQRAWREGRVRGV